MIEHRIPYLYRRENASDFVFYSMAHRFKAVDRNTPYMMPPSVQEWVPEEHLAQFVVEIVERLDLCLIENAYSGRGSRAYPPAMMLAMLVYGYATGVFSSRKLERAAQEWIPMRYICGNLQPDHDTIATFRRRFSDQIELLFVQVLLIAAQMGCTELGTISLDGTKIKANASRHRALSRAGIDRLEAKLREEVAELLRMAEETDRSELPEEFSIPRELKRREERLKALEEAKAEIDARAEERLEKERAAYEEKMAERAAREKKTGRKTPGKRPKPPELKRKDTDQVNLTDEESRIMPVSGGGFEQAYNAQAAVDVESGLIVAAHLTQAPNDKRELEPVLEQLKTLPEELGTAVQLLADSGYYSEDNVKRCEAEKITPYIARKRKKHHRSLAELLGSEPPPEEETADPVAAMRQRMHTKEGRALYGRRKSTVEPAFAHIKHILGFRQFMLRGLKKVQGEWMLVCMAANIKKLHALTV